MVSPLTPVNGTELLLVNQDGRTVAVNRTQANLILALAGIRSAPGTSKLTERTGTEQFRALQGGMQVNMGLPDLTAYLAATGPVGFVPRHLRADLFNGTERFIVQQGVSLAAADIVQTAYIRGSGGSLGGLGGDFPGNSGGGVVTPPVGTAITAKIIAEGDSRTEGLAVGTRAKSYPAKAQALGFTAPTGSTLTLINIGTSGLQVSGDNGSGQGMAYNGFPTRTGAQLDKTMDLNIATIFGGTNDGDVGDGTVTGGRVVYKGIRTWGRRVDYWGITNSKTTRRALLTESPRGNGTAPGPNNGYFDATTLPLNVLYRDKAVWSGELGFDQLIDVGGISQIDTAAKFISPYSTDFLHQLEPAYDLMAPLYKTGVDAMIAGPTTRVRPPMTFNPMDQDRGVLSNGNRSWNMTQNAPGNAKAYPSIAVGEKRYWETQHNGGTDTYSGICGEAFEDVLGIRYAHQGQTSAFAMLGDGSIQYNGTTLGTLGATFNTTSQVIQWAVDRALNVFWARYPTGNWNGNASANPATGTGGIAIPAAVMTITEGYTGRLYPVVGAFSVNAALICTTRFTSAEMTSGFTVSGFLRMDQ
jgi:hypothetical protein